MVYVTSDLHGYSLEKFQDFLDKIRFCDEDFLYILGDVIDRGADGIKLLEWIMLQPNIELLLGNHEAMMLACEFLFEEITEDFISDLTNEKLDLYINWVSDCGRVTLDALSTKNDEEIQNVFDYIREAPLYETLTVNGKDFILVHGGLGGFQKDKKLSAYAPEDLLWTRPDLNTRYFEDFTVVLGHTPTGAYGEEYTGKIIKTDTWINVDVGVGAGMDPCLLRLEDLQEFYYSDLKNKIS